MQQTAEPGAMCDLLIHDQSTRSPNLIVELNPSSGIVLETAVLFAPNVRAPQSAPERE